MCKRESSAKFEDKSPTLSYSADHNGQFAPFLTIECRGLEFVGFDPTRVRFNSSSIEEHAQIKSQGTWKCVGAESGTAFPEVDLSEGEWVDYDEKVRAISPLSSALDIKPFQKCQGRPSGRSLRCGEQVASSIIEEKLYKNFRIGYSKCTRTVTTRVSSKMVYHKYSTYVTARAIDVRAS